MICRSSTVFNDTSLVTMSLATLDAPGDMVLPSGAPKRFESCRAFKQLSFKSRVIWTPMILHESCLQGERKKRIILAVGIEKHALHFFDLCHGYPMGMERSISYAIIMRLCSQNFLTYANQHFLYPKASLLQQPMPHHHPSSPYT